MKLAYFNKLHWHTRNFAVLAQHFYVVSFCTPDRRDLVGFDVILAPLDYYWDENLLGGTGVKLIASNTTSDQHIDVDWCERQGIKVLTLEGKSVLQDVSATAELTMGLIIALTRNVFPAKESVSWNEWSRWEFGGKRMLRNMTLGVIGYGRLGRMVANYARAFGMKVLWHDKDIYGDSFEKVVGNSDVVTAHIPLTGNERFFSDFSQFKDGAYFVNTSRGEIVDDQALVAALNSSKLAGAAVDVLSGEFEEMFDVSIHPLVKYAREHDNLIITPHIGGSTEDAWYITQETIVENILESFGLNSGSKR